MTVFSHSVADMDGKSNAGRKICAPLLLLTNDGAYAIITLYEGKEVTNYKKSRENRKIFIWSKKGAENQALFRGLQKKLIMGQRTRSGL